MLDPDGQHYDVRATIGDSVVLFNLDTGAEANVARPAPVAQWGTHVSTAGGTPTVDQVRVGTRTYTQVPFFVTSDSPADRPIWGCPSSARTASSASTSARTP